jgi:hypothetical protein
MTHMGERNDMSRNRGDDDAVERTVANSPQVDGSGSDARDTLDRGAPSAEQGEADRGREPEYYGQEHDPGA